jgi:hypothetical protein
MIQIGLRITQNPQKFLGKLIMASIGGKREKNAKSSKLRKIGIIAKRRIIIFPTA